MKRALRVIGIGMAVIVALVAVFSVVMFAAGGDFSLNLPVEHTEEFVPDPNVRYPSRLRVDGNEIVDERGVAVRLRGLMAADPAVLRDKGRHKRRFYAQMAQDGAKVLRVPVHPENWVEDPDYLWRYLDPVVTWAGELGLYVIIDWHYIGNPVTGEGQNMPDIDRDPMELSAEFWDLVARYFRSAPHVILELYNEPADINASAWHSAAAELLSRVRDQGAQQLVIIGGIEYSRDLSWVLNDPFRDKAVAYAAHIYPAHAAALWNHWFGRVAVEYPVIVTEWGFMQPGETSPAQEAEAPYLLGRAHDYGRRFMRYLDERDIGWVACWYDDEWLPSMFTSGWETTTTYGAFVLDLLQG